MKKVLPKTLKVLTLTLQLSSFFFFICEYDFCGSLKTFSSRDEAKGIEFGIIFWRCSFIDPKK